MLAQATQYSDKVSQFDGRGDWGQGMHYMMGYGGYGAFPPLGVLLWVATWILVVMVLIALFRWLWRKGDNRGR